jgi:putative ABC transport system ATP-binding protein
MAKPLVQLTGVTKTYMTGEVAVEVLRGIDLSIDPGEQLAIMGRSGSGKTTLVNILGCLDKPTSGSYHFSGDPVESLDDDTISRLRGRTIGFVFQTFHLLASLTASQNVQLPMQYQGVGEAERVERAKELLSQVGLGHRIEHRPNQLSGGERQRVAIARALANHPSLLLADEPTGNLDSQARDAILTLFDEIYEKTRTTMIVVTHDPSIADRARRVIRVADGLVVSDEVQR